MAIETTSIVCGHVFRAEREIEVVIHHSDGLWQLVCGKHDHPDDCSDFEAVGLEHLVERQPNVTELSELPRGWLAEKNTDGWRLKEYDE